ncbi:MAG: hypothetical protein Q8P49_00110 [Candidatus Liptonbacteria bacterium]|nr:hypothetical protein [Candidatus Liptonbacteria bacterium]
MAYERPFRSGQKLEIIPAESPFAGAGDQSIPFVWVISDDGNRLIVESAIDGLPFLVSQTILIVPPGDSSAKTKFQFRPLDEYRTI